MTDFLLHPDNRTDAERLSSLLENGVGASFNLAHWSKRARSCTMLSTLERLDLLLEPCRTDVSRLIALQSLENDVSRAHLVNQCVYAEITTESFQHILSHHLPPLLPTSRISSSSSSPPPSLTFYDLGSGTGKNVFYAITSGLFGRAVGIELLPELHAVAAVLCESFCDDVLDSSMSSLLSVEMRLGSFCDDLEWVHASDVVYCNTIMFDKDLMIKLARAATGMKRGALFITTGPSLIEYIDGNLYKEQLELEKINKMPFQIVETFSTAHSFSQDVETFVHQRL